MDGLVGRLLGLVPGALMAVLGAYMAASGNYRLLHGYHYATTPEARRPRLAREVGASTVVLGAGVALVVPGLMPDWAVLVGVALLAGGLVAMVAFIVRENGGLVTAVAGAPLGLGPRPSSPASSRRSW